MTVLPLYASVQGDTMIVVVLGRLEATVRDLAENMLRATAIRVRRRATFRLMSGERSLDLDASLAAEGLQPLERVDLIWD